MDVAAGTHLGPYKIVALIGQGGMGRGVSRPRPRLGRDVAIKFSKEQFTERFEREARAVASLNHPNICTLFDVGPNYLVMEYIEGESPKGPLPVEEALRIAGQIAEALEAYFRGSGNGDHVRERALRLRGSLNRREADHLRRETQALRKQWR